MSLKPVNPNDSEGSLLDLSKLSKESKKRKARRKKSEIEKKPQINTNPTIFKNTELELNENLLNYIHKLEFLIEKSHNQLTFEREKFKDLLFCIGRNFSVNLGNFLNELDSNEIETKNMNFYEEILKKYDPKIIPKTLYSLPRIQKQKIRNKSAASGVSPNENYNIIKFSLNTTPSAQPAKEKPEKKPRKRAEKASINGSNPRKKPKIEETSPQNQVESLNMPANNGMLGFKNMNFQPYFNSGPQQGFGFLNNNAINNNNMQQFSEENKGIGLDAGQKYQGNYLPFTNFYSLLNDPNNKELLGLFNSAMMGEQVNEILQNSLWNNKFAGNLDPNFVKKMKENN